jgi:glycosyltransferase involved in cell wall biosynthesis
MIPHMPIVSVIIPNYNYAQYLVQRFESIIEQTFKDFEIIFLDDHSTDNSVVLAAKILAATDISYCIIENERNSGSPFGQWNKGAQQAKGKYCWIAEADDFSDYRFLETLVALIQQQENIGIAYCQTCPVDPRGIPMTSPNYIQYTDFLDPYKWLKKYVNNGRDEVEKYLCRLCSIINVSSVLFTREIFLRTAHVAISYKQAGDWMTYIKILEHSDIAYTPEKLNFHRIHTAKKTQNTVTNLIYFKEMLRVFRYTHQHFAISEQTQEYQFRHILWQWNEHYNGPYGRISKRNNSILFLHLIASYPHHIKTIIAQYIKTFQ